MKLLLLIFLSLNAMATDQIVPKWGFEKNIIKYTPGTGERIWGLEYIRPINKSKHVKLKLEIGSWIARHEGRKSSMYLVPSWGYRIEPIWGIFAAAYVGIGWIAVTDTELGGHFQIFHDINWGFIQDGWGLGLGFKHISSAGVYTPNRGRDSLSARFMINL